MRRGTKFFILVIIILLIMLAGFFIYKYFFVEKTNTFVIKNKYYSFELKTPKNWMAEENTSYSEENISKLLDECKNDKSGNNNAYQVGVFRFEDQKYPQGLGYAGQTIKNVPTGAVLEVSVNCSPILGDKNYDYNFGSLKVAGEKAFEGFLDLIGSGKTKYISFFHNNLQYKVSEYVYISPQDKNKNEASIRKGYDKIFNKIISSFKFD